MEPILREWTTIKEYEEILFDYYNGIARITINRERYRNAFIILFALGVLFSIYNLISKKVGTL